jgi:predicted amidohydrolase
MSMRQFFLGVGQIRVQPGRRRENMENAITAIDVSQRGGADMVLLPEALPLGWTQPSAREEAEPVPDGEWCRALCSAAKRNKVWVCSGVIERDQDRIFNSAVLISSEGEIALVHRKINELDIAHELYAQGDRLSVVDTPFGRIGVMICADAFAKDQAISRALGMMGAQVILSPCSWVVPADHDHQREPYGQLWLDNYQPVAREFGLWIAGVSNVGPITDGPWNGRKCIGCSLVIGPKGEIAYRAPYGEAAEHFVAVMIAPELRPRAWSGG